MTKSALSSAQPTTKFFECLEGRLVPTASIPDLVVGCGPEISLVDPMTGTIGDGWLAESGVIGSQRVGLGDFDSDERLDSVILDGPTADSESRLTVFRDQSNAELVPTFTPFSRSEEPLPQHLQLAVGDLDRDGIADLVVAGRQVVRVFSGRDPAVILHEFSPFTDTSANFPRVAVGDVTGDGQQDLIVAEGPGNQGLVRVFDGLTDQQVAEFAPFAGRQGARTGGVFIAAGDLDGDNRDEVVVGRGAGLANANARIIKLTNGAVQLTKVTPFTDFTGALRVAIGDMDGDGTSEVVLAEGAGGSGRMRIFGVQGEPAFTQIDMGETAAVFVAAPPATIQVNSVAAWNELALDVIRLTMTPPPAAARALAMMHTAIYDAVTAVTPTYTAYLSRPSVENPVAIDAAIAAAGRNVLQAVFPAQFDFIESFYSNSLALLPDGALEDAGVALGEATAAAILADRANDGSNDAVSYTPGSDPGDWRPTPPGFQAALLPQWPSVEPFGLTSGSQFRPAGPPAITSEQYAEELAEVAALGRATNSTRTDDQTAIARFWADGAGTFTPPGHWNAIAQTIARRLDFQTLDQARLFAMLNITLADAAIAAWDAKYTYNQWRPVTAITNADSDGNELTIADPDWLPLLATPPFPDYISGHSTFSGAAAEVLNAFAGNQMAFVSTADDGLSTRKFNSFDMAANEAGRSRIFGGIHLESSNQDGLITGQSIAEYVLSNWLKPEPQP